MSQFAKECPRKASVQLNYRGPGQGASSKEFLADVQRQQVPKRDQLTYRSYRWSHSEWPKRDADVDSNTLWEQEQALLILEQRPRGTGVSPGRKTREHLQPRVEIVGISHDIYGPRGVVVAACIERTQVEALLDTGATADLIRADVAQDLLDLSEIEPYRGRLETADGQEMKVDGCITARLKLRAVDKDLDMLVVSKLKAEMVFGLRLLKENRCTLTFSHDEDFLWTGVKEGSMVPIPYLPPIVSPRRILSTPHDPRGKKEGDG